MSKIKNVYRIIGMLILTFILVFDNPINSEAVTIVTRSWENKTLKGTNVYVTDNGPTGHFVMTFTSNANLANMNERIILKNKNGINNPPIVAGGTDISSISTRTDTFYDYAGTYTMKGIYEYSVQSYSGKQYIFSVTY